MVDARRQEARVGGAAIALCAAAVALSFVFGDSKEPDPLRFQVDFPAASGLKVGSKVSIAGVPAGEVSAMTAHDGAYDTNLGRRVYVRVDLEIEDAMARLIRQDATFVITTEGMLGERYVEVTPGKHDAPLLANGLILKGSRSFQQKELSENASTLSESVGRLARAHGQELAMLGQQVDDMLASASSGMERAEGVVEGSRERWEAFELRSEETFERGKQLLKQAHGSVLRQRSGVLAQDIELTRRLFAKKGPALSRAADETFERVVILKDAGDALAVTLSEGGAALKRSGLSLPRDVRAIRALVSSAETSLGALLSDREFLDDVLGLTKDVKRHPWKMLMRWEH